MCCCRKPASSSCSLCTLGQLIHFAYGCALQRKQTFTGLRDALPAEVTRGCAGSSDDKKSGAQVQSKASTGWSGLQLHKDWVEINKNFDCACSVSGRMGSLPGSLLPCMLRQARRQQIFSTLCICLKFALRRLDNRIGPGGIDKSLTWHTSARGSNPTLGQPTLQEEFQ